MVLLRSQLCPQVFAIVSRPLLLRLCMQYASVSRLRFAKRPRHTSESNLRIFTNFNIDQDVETFIIIDW